MKKKSSHNNRQRERRPKIAQNQHGSNKSAPATKKNVTKDSGERRNTSISSSAPKKKLHLLHEKSFLNMKLFVVNI